MSSFFCGFIPSDCESYDQPSPSYHRPSPDTRTRTRSARPRHDRPTARPRARNYDQANTRPHRATTNTHASMHELPRARVARPPSATRQRSRGTETASRHSPYMDSYTAAATTRKRSGQPVRSQPRLTSQPKYWYESELGHGVDVMFARKVWVYTEPYALY